MTSCCHRRRMRWNEATGAIARCKTRSTGYARRCRSVHAWRWICGVKPTPKAGNKPSPHSIVHGLDKPGVFTTVSADVVLSQQGYDTLLSLLSREAVQQGYIELPAPDRLGWRITAQ